MERIAKRLGARHAAWSLALALKASSVMAQDAGALGPVDASLGDDVAEAPDPRVAALAALTAGTLDLGVAPQSLFDVSLSDEAAIQIEATRLGVLIDALDEAQRPRALAPRPGARRTTAPVDAGPPRVDPSALDSPRWRAQLGLDRARLRFYRLAPEVRAAQLAAHAARQAAAAPRETDAQRRAREAEAERRRALADAQAARSEAERLVSEELARLIALEHRVNALGDGVRARDAAVARQRDAVLGWQRRVRDARGPNATLADVTYDALRVSLRAARAALAAALDAEANQAPTAPNLGPDLLVNLPPEVSAAAVRQRRSAIAQSIVALQRDEEGSRRRHAAAYLDAIDALNRERLSLLPFLSAEKRDAILGFTPEGWEQARAEARHLSLILRYHRQAARQWVARLRHDRASGLSLWRIAAVLAPLLGVLATFVWGRRRAAEALDWAIERVAASDRAERRTSPGPELRALRFLQRVRRPIAWSLLSAAVFWLLPAEARAVFELQLLASALRWSLLGALVIDSVNAFAAASGAGVEASEEGAVGRLRLRSLRLVGRTVVAFALVLVLSARLVGEGTIYDWVFSTCWFAAVPIFLVLVRWWRGMVFERLERQRKHSRFQTWILANRRGWQSFAAAMGGAVLLFGGGLFRLLRGWLLGFDAARRIHAYYYKLEIERIDDAQADEVFAPLAAASLEALHPERAAARWLPCPADAVRDALIARGNAHRGGVFAVVAPRGMGKTTLLAELARGVADHVEVRCRASMPAEAVTRADASGPAMVLVDDAHTLIASRIGGFSRFDAVIHHARASAAARVWVFAFDASVWPLLRRARDARPLFDETFMLAGWSETELAALMSDRCALGAVVPCYDRLLDPLPVGADEHERREALASKRLGYERMVWDHVGGNPGLAMEVWRSSLASDAEGVVHVRPLRTQAEAKLEGLSDASLFVLRAVLQLAPTDADTVAEATRRGVDEVLEDLRYGVAQGFYEETDGQYRIAWPWLRAATQLLERRHLLVTV